MGATSLAACSFELEGSSIELSHHEHASQVTPSLSVEVLKDFEGLTFNDETVPYDGAAHSLSVNNLPEGAVAVYTGNNQIDPGTYTVTAVISKDGYNTKTMVAKLTITAAKFSGISFKDDTFIYDGKYHSIKVEGAPSFATVKYSGNDKKDIGDYQVTATISAKGYETITLKATMHIIKDPSIKPITGVTFEDATFEYDGKPHSIEVKGLPSDATVRYSNNNQRDRGTYRVTATITGEKYETLTLTATLSIINPYIKDLQFTDVTMIEGKPIRLKVAGKLPTRAEVSYSIKGYSSLEQVTAPGTYEVYATVTAPNYSPTVLKANLTIIKNDFHGVDTNKNAFQFTSDTKYQELKDELLKGNYTCEISVEDDYFYPDGTTRHQYGNAITHYVDGDKYVMHYDLRDPTAEDEDFLQEQWTFAEVVGDYSFSTTTMFSAFTEGIGKAPKDSYKETYQMRSAMEALSHISESSDGGFDDGTTGGYRTSYGTPMIDIANNEIRITVRRHYFHTEFNHDEMEVYTLKNIGNTKVNIPEIARGKVEEANSYSNESFTQNGVDYTCLESFDTGELSWRANISFDAADVEYLPHGDYHVYAQIYGVPVTTFDYDYYDSRYELDLTGYTLCFFFDDDGIYKGDYASLGSIPFSNLRIINAHFEVYNGTAKYYGEW